MADSGDVAWIIVSTALVQFMTPGLGFFYGGFVSEKAVVNTIMLSFGTMGVITVLWALIGYSLAFGPSTSTGVIGDASLGVLSFGTTDTLRSGYDIPELLYMVYQCMFAVITPAVISGAVVTKMKYMWFLAFACCWHIFVYCPLAHWVWAPDGWMYTYGVLDFAGGTVVETASGVSAIVLAYWLGKHTHVAPVQPHNVPYILLGAALLWFGWFGFNAGSAISSGDLAGRALVNTHLAAAMAMITWGFLEVVTAGDEGWFNGRPTSIGAASGAVVGLVAITPACGYVLPMWGMFIGFFGAFVVFFALKLIKWTAIDDRLDVFAFHGIAGMVGTAMTGLFATKEADAPNDGSFYGDGGKQFGKQLAAISATILLCSVGTTLIFWFLNGIAYLLKTDMRIPEEHAHDIDASQHGEKAYFGVLNSHFLKQMGAQVSIPDAAAVGAKGATPTNAAGVASEPTSVTPRVAFAEPKRQEPIAASQQGTALPALPSGPLFSGAGDARKEGSRRKSKLSSGGEADPANSASRSVSAQSPAADAV